MKFAAWRSALSLMIVAGVILSPHLCSVGQTVSANAQPAASSDSANSQRVITFNFTRDGVGVPIPRYKLTVRDDGSGHYEGEALPPPTRYGPAASSAAIPFQRDLRLTTATTARIFDLAAQLDHFNRVCASKAKNIANTGTKTISYSGPGGPGSCIYNYTDVKELAALTELIEGITETMDQGRELDRLHRYDRLGLDSAMSNLQQEAAAGRALELQTIGDSLSAIASDGDVLARVRAKASAMLSQSAAAQRDAAR